MARVAYTRKVFQYRIEIDGIDEFEVQKASLPEVEIDSVSHGDTNRDIKTPGRIKTGDLVLEKLRPIGSDNTAWDKLALAQNPITGGGVLPVQIKEPIIFKEMDSTGLITLNRTIMTGCWIKKLKKSDYDRMKSDNVLQTITYSVDEAIDA